MHAVHCTAEIAGGGGNVACGVIERCGVITRSRLSGTCLAAGRVGRNHAAALPTLIN